MSVRRRERKRMAGVARVPITAPNDPNRRWSMDFIADALANGPRVRVLAVIDDFTRECLATEVDTSIPGLRVTRGLEQLARRTWDARADHGGQRPRVLGEGVRHLGVCQRGVAAPHRPWQAGPERVHREFQREARRRVSQRALPFRRPAHVESWRDDYNAFRPHSALGNRTPEEFAQQVVRNKPVGL